MAGYVSFQEDDQFSLALKKKKKIRIACWKMVLMRLRSISNSSSVPKNLMPFTLSKKELN